MLTKKELQDELQNTMRYCLGELNRFAKKFQEDAFHALEWSGDDFKHAARLRLAKILGAHLDKGNDVIDVLDWLETEALNGTRFPKHSTSPAANYASQMWLSALAELAAKIRGN